METDNITKILVLIASAGILYYYYRRWVDYNEALQKQTWPLRYPDCPDYWEKTADGSCQNKFNLGNCPKNGRCVPNTDVNTGGDSSNKLSAEECMPMSEIPCPNKIGKNNVAGACKWDSGASAYRGVVDFSTANSNLMKIDKSSTKEQRENALHKRCRYAKDCGISWEGVEQLCA